MSRFVLTEVETQALQAAGLNLVRYFDAFCRENHLTYFLCGGCCIGAIRHQGFIPWDDDVDVFMPREDYEKLKLLWKDSDKYAIQYETQQLHTAHPFLTIHDNETTFIETYKKDLDINHGIKLDVLPLDGCPEGFARTMQKLWAMAYSLFLVGKAPENHGNATFLLGKVILSLFPSRTLRYRIWRFCEKKMTQYPIGQCRFITELCSGPGYMQLEYPAELFSQQKYVPFEDLQLPIPVGYDTYLKMAFGDYMTLPAPEKRICHHEFECIDTDRCYLAYRGKQYCRSKDN